MSVSMEEKKAEAVSRMEMLGVFPETIQQFKNEGFVSVSEPPMGAFFWADEDDMARIRSFEEKYDALVYVVIRSYTSIGKMDSYLYVSDHDDEWEYDRADIAEKTEGVLAYVYNHDAPDSSEIGYIGVEKTPAAGLKRTW